MEAVAEPIERGSSRALSGELALRLTERIQDGTFRKGEKLPTEPALMDTYKVSRTVVREAISQLRATGLVETQQGRGSFVLTVPTQGRFALDTSQIRTDDDVADLLEFRIGIECEAAALAAERRTERELAELRRLQQRFESCVSRPSEAVEADFQLHLGIARAAHNAHFSALLRSIGPMMITMPRPRLRQDDAPGRPAPLEHEAIVAAIDRQEPETARAAVRLHLSNSRARMLG